MLFISDGTLHLNKILTKIMSYITFNPGLNLIFYEYVMFIGVAHFGLNLWLSLDRFIWFDWYKKVEIFQNKTKN